MTTAAAALVVHTGGVVTPAELWAAWTPDPWAAGLLVLALAVYERGARRLRRRSREPRLRARRAWCFRAALALLGLALLSPLETVAGTLFSAHMVQHLLLVLAAAPLLVLARPLPALLWGLPDRLRRRLATSAAWDAARSWGAALASPAAAWATSAIALWAWHAPLLYEAALASPAVHAFEHATLLGTAVLFWWVAVGPGRRGTIGRGGAVLFLFTAALHTGFLGGLITFSDVPWYGAHAAGAAAWGLTPLEDQQLAGLVMWVPMGPVYAAAALHALVIWLRELDARSAGTASVLLLAGVPLLVACGTEEPAPTRSVAGGEAEVGERLVRVHGCGSCHSIEGVRHARGLVGPPLTGFAERRFIAGSLPNRTENLVRWIRDPPSVEPGTAMPALGLSAEEARHVAAYLYTLD